jgi:transposase-like protein
MKGKRKRHGAAFKAKVGFEALVGLKTVSQLAREYAVHPTQVTQWRATIRDHMPELFEPGQPGTEDQEQLIAQLHQKIEKGVTHKGALSTGKTLLSSIFSH